VSYDYNADAKYNGVLSVTLATICVTKDIHSGLICEQKASLSSDLAIPFFYIIR
jgi:hypothetical protein